MNRMQMKGEWNELKGRAKRTWAALTDDDLTNVEGDRDRLVGAIQRRYGILQEEAEHQVDRWLDAA